MSLRVALVAVLALLLLPAGAHASQLVIGVYTQGPGTVTGSGLATPCVSTAATGTKKLCGLVTTGYADESSSIEAGFTAVADTTQPNKSTFTGWTCQSAGGVSCSGCASTSGCLFFSPLATGKYSITITATFADTTAATAPVIAPTYSTIVDRQISFGLSANDTIASATCSLNGAAFGACPPGNAYVLGEGTYTFAAKVSDPSGNVSPAASTTFQIVDTAFAAGPIGSSADTRPTFSYSSLTGTTFECSLDGAAFSACGTKAADGKAALQVGPLADGPHTFNVRAKAGAAYDRVPATRTWTVDTTPPVAALDPFSGPGQGALQAVNAETFGFSLNEAGTTECSLDGAAFAACASPLALSGLAAGTHTFSVRGTDLAGNLGAPSTRSWAVFGGVVGGGGQQPAPPIVVGAAKKLVFTLTATGKGTKLKQLQLTKVPAGATVTVTCKGRGCPRGLTKKGFVKRNASSTVSLATYIEKPIPATATITVTVSRSGSTSAVATLKTRAGKTPSIHKS